MTARDDDPWAFLDAWFLSLHGRITVDEPYRADTHGAQTFCRDPATDWWLRVDWKIENNTNRGSRDTQLRHCREALLLVGALARVDNAAWIQKLCTISGFVVPSFMDVKAHALPAHFVVAFSEFMSPRKDDFKCWFDMNNRSEAFKRDATRLRKLVHDEWTNAMPRLRIGLVFRGAEFLALIGRLLATYLKDVGDDARQPLQRARFVIDSLDLNGVAMWTDSSVLDALRCVVELGIPIHHVHMPLDRHCIGSDHLSATWREAFIRFVRTLCGHGPRVGGVHTISMSRWGVLNPEFALLCSALQHARGVRHFALTVGEDLPVAVRYNNNPFPPGVWARLALSLLSRDSTTSIVALTIQGVPIDEDDTEEVFNMVSSVHPLHAYAAEWVSNGRSSRPASRVPRKVTIPTGTELTSYYASDHEAYTVVVDEATEAFEVFEEAGVSHVFVVGRGFCEAASAALPSKRTTSSRLRRVRGQDTSSMLQSLEFVTGSTDTTSQAQLKAFVELVGGKTLRRLRLEVSNMGDEELHSVLEMCPNVEYLAVSNIVLETMAAFETARALRSLEVLQSHVPDQAFIDYLRGAWLPRDSKADTTAGKLHGLRLGQVNDAVLEQLESMLPHSSIRYLEYAVTTPLQSRFERLVEHHGKPTGEVHTPLSATSTMAFLGALRHGANTNPAFGLADELKASIVTFASTPHTRIVVCRDTVTDE